MHSEPHRSPTAFVLLARGFGGAAWNRRWREGRIIGTNEPFAYGYHHAARDGIDVVYSEDGGEGALARFWRLGWRALLGFDFVHAWRNRHGFFAADVVWTHTESQSLAAALLCRLFPRRSRPRLILQSVWLIDHWPAFHPWRRRFYRWLLAQADILSFHSPLNTALARELFSDQRCEWIRFGICCDTVKAPRETRPPGPLKVLALGNDKHRDWKTLVDAVRAMDDVRLTIVSGTCPPALVAGQERMSIARPADNRALAALYDDADLVVVPLKENLHVSGTTVIQEATLQGKPVVASRVGGLQSYFGEACVTYVPPRDAQALRHAIEAIRTLPAAAAHQVKAAQAELGDTGISSRAFARQHARWSHALLGTAALPLPAGDGPVGVGEA